ncbi:TetR/AcrR family transcriptional regulator [Breznakiella homolactica]|uniref:TetR/AcrR family transcriptional regulator n=1 Tax=Breznakiella homolactica TaxID=2798577 RepID=A0A7T7XKE8_9SPIR|nr:TetR/AcrR family transcriptional regulator [Breznakiella homolactica]QQO07981.1 TetR/AcrR family transcriptional regulator [Breznakiella homolactica]
MNRRDLQKAETCRDILTAAELLFYQQGYEQTSIQQIAEQAGLTKGAVYHHFDSKEALLQRMADDHYNTLLEAVLPIMADKTKSCFSRIAAIIQTTRNIGLRKSSFVSEYFQVRQNSNSGTLKERLRDSDKKFYRAVLAPLLAEARGTGECDFSASPEIIALFICELDRCTAEEISGIALKNKTAGAEREIQTVLGTFIYALSKMLNLDTSTVERIIGTRESMRFYKKTLSEERKRRHGRQ